MQPKLAECLSQLNIHEANKFQLLVFIKKNLNVLQFKQKS